jgi:hypothetical protein
MRNARRKRWPKLLALALVIGLPHARPALAQIPGTLGWYEIPNSRLRPVCAAENGFPQIHGNTGCPAIYSAWGGGALDTSRNRLLIWGGGHTDYAGNEVYALDLDTLTMARLNDPSSVIRDGCTNGGTYADGKPVSRHTYNQLAYLPNQDALFAWGGSQWQCGFHTNDVWSFSLASLSWTELSMTNGPRAGFGRSVAYDPNSALVYARDDFNLFSFAPAADAWTRRTATEVAAEDTKTGVIDPVRKRYYYYERDHPTTVHWYDISSATGTVTRQSLATSGCSFMTDEGSGWEYDPVQDKLVGWAGGDSVYLMNPDTGACTTVTHAGGPDALPQGIFGRFRYVPALNLFVTCNSVDTNCHVLRLTPPGGPVPSLSVDDVTVTEGNAGTTAAVFTARLSAASAQAVTVSYATANQTATAGSDYQAASGMLSFAPGAVERTVSVNALGDVAIEPDETFALNLSAAVGATVADGQGVGTIADDDAPTLAARELAHGSSLWDDLSAQTGAAGQDAFRLSQSAFSSYEVVLDAVSGDASPAVLERLAADNVTVLQTGTGTGGGARSLRWENASGTAVTNQHVRVRSSGCASACGPDDVYRIRAWETTGRIARFNNSGSQGTVLILQNPGGQPVTGRAHFWSGSGSLLGTHPFTLGGRATLALNTLTLSVLVGQAGSVTVTHDAGYGGLLGKAVSLEPSTGFSFDAPMGPRPR